MNRKGFPRPSEGHPNPKYTRRILKKTHTHYQLFPTTNGAENRNASQAPHDSPPHKRYSGVLGLTYILHGMKIRNFSPKDGTSFLESFGIKKAKPNAARNASTIVVYGKDIPVRLFGPRGSITRRRGCGSYRVAATPCPAFTDARFVRNAKHQTSVGRAVFRRQRNTAVFRQRAK